MNTLSVIILSNTIDEDIHRMNNQCLDSLFSSENWNDVQLDVLLLESGANHSWKYDERVRVLFPKEKFNFHCFLNIGIQETAGDFIAFCNNDIIFSPGWFSAILKVNDSHPEFQCFSPLDRNYPLMKEDILPSSEEYYIGWENKKHFAAWCFVWKRNVFNTIGAFDESFNFYYADDDELQTLRYHAIPNVVVTGSEVRHLSQVVTKKDNKQNSHAITNKEEYPLTREELRRGYSWLWDDERFYWGYQNMKSKWGNERMRRRVDRFIDRHPALFVRPITKILYNKKINNLLCFLTGIKK